MLPYRRVHDSMNGGPSFHEVASNIGNIMYFDGRMIPLFYFHQVCGFLRLSNCPFVVPWKTCAYNPLVSSLLETY